ncbi:hypothetical protein XENOCAPTIV_015988 [Xenoophorus captivus]|uniref:Uncharacterized protein n=1 Tax=Xenoophorus captivus TaxID=1517983 RepID=A0ABV0R3V9_9TELE
MQGEIRVLLVRSEAVTQSTLRCCNTIKYESPVRRRSDRSVRIIQEGEEGVWRILTHPFTKTARAHGPANQRSEDGHAISVRLVPNPIHGHAVSADCNSRGG